MATLFVLTSFFAAALLFLAEPMVGRMVLPAFGGSPQVWTTAMLFFQVALLGGYAYAHEATARISARRQPWIHVALALLALFFLPITLTVAPSGAGGGSPVRELLVGLMRSVGVPFLLVATSGPLLQRWFSWTNHPAARDPYFLYAASNAGSAVGLIAYPFVVEPTLGVVQQSRWWAGGYAIMLGLLVACAAAVARRPAAAQVGGRQAEGAATAIARPPLWIACAFVPSTVMLAATTMISTDIAAVPLLWVLPLGLYLVTFTVAFSPLGSRVLRVAKVLALPVSVLAIVIDGPTFGAPAAVLVQLLFVVVGGLVGHGMLAEARPAPAELTRFYLFIGVGGALGGVFNGIVAPLLFNALFEHGLAAAALVALVVRWRPMLRARRGWDVPIELAPTMLIAAIPIWLLFARLDGRLPASAAMRWAYVAAALAPLSLPWGRNAIAVLSVLTVGLAGPLRTMTRADFTTRTFFGLYQVSSLTGMTQLTNGTTAHGTQDQRTSAARLRPLSYYDPLGPLGWVMDRPRGDIGVIGLGAGAVAAYGRPGQTIVFHEIDPEVERIARRWFTYLGDSKAHIETVIGDGRLTVDRVPKRYDILLVDGFTSDAIPVHLITVEAFRTYLNAIKEDGMIAVHITNRFLNLEPVMKGISEALGVEAVGGAGVSLDNITSVWVVFSRDHERIEHLRASGWSELTGRPVVWTDQRSSIFSIID